MSATESLALAAIRIDGGTQPRAVISEETVRDYAECMTAGSVLPPIDVFFDGTAHWLADGFHRYFSAKRIDRLYLTATVHVGTKRDAVLFSVSANAGHGLQRTNADKRKAVMTLLSDGEWTAWSNKEIARRCGVNSSLVDDMRKASLPSNGSEEVVPRTYTTKHGTKSTMKVEKIGRSAKPKTTPDRSPKAAMDRRRQIRELAEAGHSSRQIAATVGITLEGCRDIARKDGIDIPADRVIGKSALHDSNRIVARMVIDAENLTADVNLIDFSGLDRERLGEWADSLIASKKALDIFIRRLIKEQQNHGEAA